MPPFGQLVADHDAVGDAVGGEDRSLDFAQPDERAAYLDAEVDPAVVNLSVFETTFSEKRPFFVSNSQYFSTGGLNCFFCSNVSSLNFIYTRRIGRSPQLSGLLSGRSDFIDAR